MKNKSVKIKISLLLTALTAILALLLAVVSVIISTTVAVNDTRERLENTVRENLRYVTPTERAPVIDENFIYYKNGVSTLVYSGNETLIAGQIPVNFKAAEPFEKGRIRTVESGGNEFLIMDMWIPLDWNNGVWVRGLTDMPDSDSQMGYMFTMALITLPLFVLLAALGSYHIIKRSFIPLDRIADTVKGIDEGKDLSGRINLPQTGDEFSLLADGFDDMLARLEKSFEAEKQFTSDASHELRTPVAIIKSACEYGAKFDETEEEHKETLSVIARQADKMTNLINRLLAMTRMEQGTQKLTFENHNLSLLLNKLCEEQGWQNKNVIVDIPKGISVKADKEMLCRLVQNLVENSFKYGRENSKVTVNAQKTDREILLSVKDEGEGIPAEYMEKIWQRFYQIDGARSNDDNGTGLGLAIVKQIAALHGGYMEVQSEEGKGSEFTLHLPLNE